MSARKKHIGIVGGGILGMTLALRLQQCGFQVTLLEASDALGGTLRPSKIGDYTWDCFYHVILMSDTDLLDLLDQVKLRDQIRWQQTKTGFFTDKKLYSMSNVMEFLTFPPLSLIDKLRLGATIFYASRLRSPNGLEGVLVSDWLKKLSGKRTFNKIWLPLLKSKLGENYKVTSASFIWASISRLYKARRRGLKQEMFGYVEGGYATVLSRFRDLLKEQGVDIIFETSVTEVVHKDTDATVKTPAGRTIGFDELILTLPCNDLERICPQFSDAEKRRFGRVIYEDVVCAVLLVKNPLTGFYITNITEEWVPFTAAIEMTAVVDRKYFGGDSLIYLPLYLRKGDPLYEQKDENILGQFLDALNSIHRSFRREDVVAWKVNRATEVFPVTTLNYTAEALPSMQTSLKHIYVVNSAQIAAGTMNVNEIVGLANRKAEEIVNLVRG